MTMGVNIFNGLTKTQTEDNVVEESSLKHSSIEDSDSNERDDDENGDTSLVDSDNHYNDAAAEVRLALKDSDRSVYRCRFVLKIMMIVVAILLTIATHVQLSRTEYNDFTKKVSC
jgi:DNA-directed RNA polymerase specialized sigma subunit